MRGPDYVLEKAQNRYRGIWRDTLLGADPGVYTVALDPPSAAEVTTRASDVSAWLTRWRQWATQHPNVTLRTRTIRTKFVAALVDVAAAATSPTAASSTDTRTAMWRRKRDRAAPAPGLPGDLRLMLGTVQIPALNANGRARHPGSRLVSASAGSGRR